MTDPKVAVDEVVASFDRDPEFLELKRRQRMFVFPMTVVFLVFYMLLIIAAGYWKGFMKHEVGGVINVAYLFALANILTTFLIAFIYTRYANSQLDPLAKDIKERLEAKGGGR